jgi:hypothetical protein
VAAASSSSSSSVRISEVSRSPSSSDSDSASPSSSSSASCSLPVFVVYSRSDVKSPLLDLEMFLKQTKMLSVYCNGTSNHLSLVLLTMHHLLFHNHSLLLLLPRHLKIRIHYE